MKCINRLQSYSERDTHVVSTEKLLDISGVLRILDMKREGFEKIKLYCSNFPEPVLILGNVFLFKESDILNWIVKNSSIIGKWSKMENS